MQTTSLKGANLSPLQEQAWLWSQRSNIYHAQCAVCIKGALQMTTFQQALQEMIDAHEILHTVFYALPGMELPVQVIAPHAPVSCPVISLEGITALLQDEILTTAFDLLSQKPCDLAHGPVLRAFLHRLAPETHLFLFNLPALCADATTLQGVVADLFQRYESLSRQSTINEEPLQYIDVSAWQKDLLEEEHAKTPSEFWKRFDLSQIHQMRLPLSRTEGLAWENAQQGDFTPEMLVVTAEPALSTSLRMLLRDQRVSPSVFFLACWQTLLWRLTGEAEQIIGVAGNGRIYEELANAIGLYTRSVPVSVPILAAQSFEQLVSLVNHSFEQAMQWQSYFSWSALRQMVTDGAAANYFPITFEYEHWPEAFSCGPLTISLSQRFYYNEPFILKLNVLSQGDLLAFELHYDTRYLSKGQVQCIASALSALVQDVVKRTDTPISTLRLVTQPEQVRLLTMFQRSQIPLLPRDSFHQLFEDQVRLAPNQLALRDFDEQLTYQQVNERANQLAHVLRRRGVAPNVLVALYLPRSAQAIVCLLAIFKAGGAYIPLDANSPGERLAYQLQNAQPRFLLTRQALFSQLPSWDGAPLSLEALWQEAVQEPRENLSVLCQPDDLAYVMYTSGSTGVPKGVMISQRSIINYSRALCDLLGVEAGWSFATVSTLAADLGNTAIFCALASGGLLHIPDYATITSAESFAQWAVQNPIDVLKIVPSHLSALLAGKPREEILPRQALVLGGEALPLDLLQQIHSLQGNCTIYNHYGPTETTIGVLVNKIGVEQQAEANCKRRPTQNSVPLGQPIAGTEVYILDPWMQPVPEGVVGELYIGGCGLANGYLHQSDQTAARFVPHLWSEKEGARLYRTGDLVCSQQGQIEFVGRSDHQVKLRGYRIEVGEIEATLKRHPQVRDSVVMLREDKPGEAHLEGYIIARSAPGPTSKELREFLRAYVPEYMVPSTFVTLKALPLTANGKLDRRQLVTSRPASAVLGSEGETRAFVQPRDEIEFRLLRIWEEILQVQPISVTDNFFDLGGHSILAVRLMSQIFQQFGQDLPLATLFQRPTMADLAIALRQEQVFEDQPIVVALQTQGTRPPFFCAHPSGGSVFCYVNLARYLGPDQPFYGLQATSLSTSDAVVSLEDLASHYVAAIQAIQPQGPYFVGGWSMGGITAFEIAQQLRRQGHEVALLAIIDGILVDPQTRTGVIEKKSDYTDEEIVREEVQNYHIPVPADFDQLDIIQQKAHVVAKAKEMQLIPPDFVFEQIRPVFRMTKVHQHLAHTYIAQHYPYCIDYFQSVVTATVGTSTDPTPVPEAPEHFRLWREIAQGELNIHPLPGDHLSMMEEPHVQALAASLKQRIDSICQSALFLPTMEQ